MKYTLETRVTGHWKIQFGFSPPDFEVDSNGETIGSLVEKVGPPTLAGYHRTYELQQVNEAKKVIHAQSHDAYIWQNLP